MKLIETMKLIFTSQVWKDWFKDFVYVLKRILFVLINVFIWVPRSIMGLIYTIAYSITLRPSFITNQIEELDDQLVVAFIMSSQDLKSDKDSEETDEQVS